MTTVTWTELTGDVLAQLLVAAYLASLIANYEPGLFMRQKKSVVATALCRCAGDHPQTGGWNMNRTRSRSKNGAMTRMKNRKRQD